MSNEDILEKAREAGLLFNEDSGTEVAIRLLHGRILKFAKLLIEEMEPQDV